MSEKKHYKIIYHRGGKRIELPAKGCSVPYIRYEDLSEEWKRKFDDAVKDIFK